jgi:hypothetical protein
VPSSALWHQAFTEVWTTLWSPTCGTEAWGALDLNGSARRRSRVIAEAEYVDDDGVSVSIELNVDEKEELFELDFWKVDFSPLRRYPNPEDLKPSK